MNTQDWGLTIFFGGVGQSLPEYYTHRNKMVHFKKKHMLMGLVQHICDEVSKSNMLGVFSLDQVWANPLYKEDPKKPVFVWVPSKLCHTTKATRYLKHISRFYDNYHYEAAETETDLRSAEFYRSGSFTVIISQCTQLLQCHRISSNDELHFWPSIRKDGVNPILKTMGTEQWKTSWLGSPHVEELIKLIDLADTKLITLADMQRWIMADIEISDW